MKCLKPPVVYVYHHKSWQVFLPAKDRDITVASSNAHDTKMPCSSLGCNAGPFQTISIRHSKVLFPQGISKGIPSGNQRINGKSPKTRRFVARKTLHRPVSSPACSKGEPRVWQQGPLASAAEQVEGLPLTPSLIEGFSIGMCDSV